MPTKYNTWPLVGSGIGAVENSQKDITGISGKYKGMLLKLDQASEIPGGLIQMQILIHRCGVDIRVCILNMFWVMLMVLRPHFWVARLQKSKKKKMYLKSGGLCLISSLLVASLLNPSSASLEQGPGEIPSLQSYCENCIKCHASICKLLQQC